MLHINIKQKFQFWSEGSESLIFLAKTPNKLVLILVHLFKPGCAIKS